MRRQHATAAVAFIVMSVAMTWPLARNLDRAVSDPGDPYITTWILDWGWWATFRAPLSLFHANAFHPAEYSLAFSENMYGIAMLLFPLRAIGVSALAAHNIALLAGFVFSGFGAYLLGQRLTGSWIAGMAAGVFYAFVPFRFTHLPHLQHIWGGWLPLLLVALLAYARTPTRRRAWIFAAVFVMNGLTNVHYLFFGALASAITAALLIPRSQWRELAIATGGALLILGPFLYPYAAVADMYGMLRPRAEVAGYSAQLRDWLPGRVTEPERRLYPGALAYVAALLALVIARKQKAQLSLALLWMAIGVFGSLGLNFVFHEFLYGAMPGFRALRVPARWAVIAYIGMAMLIALLTAALARRNRWIALVVPVMFFATLWAAPIRWYLTDPKPAEVDRWLATQPVRAIAQIPLDDGASEYEYLFRATVHHRPMINGVSGFAPPGRDRLGAMSKETPVPDAFLDALAKSGVELLIVHADSLGERAPVIHEWLRRELDRGRIGFVRRFHSPRAGSWVFRLGVPRVPRSTSEYLGGSTASSPRGTPRYPEELRGTQQLQDFLAGQPTCSAGTMGALDFPPPRLRFDHSAIFSGWAMSPHGIQSVDLWFDNRTVKLPAQLSQDPFLALRCPRDKHLARTRYVGQFIGRPGNIRRRTDVQVEVTDGRGEKTVFDNRWITWD
ncbi:MAG TPA: hypothetical protein VEK79_26240 [Thermoanaerobaculia bacterium]|nr:hypothetical protein [Thermoanaerobaculia bacterium]